MGNGESRSFTGCPGGLTVESAPGGHHVGLSADGMAKLKLQSIAFRESLDDRFKRYMGDFSVSEAQLQKIVDAFVDECKLGLELWREASARGVPIDPKDCSFKMLDSCVKDLPSGKEKGVYYAIDFGGTNFRAVRLGLQGDGKIDLSQFKTNLTNPEVSSHPKGLMDKSASATELFDFFSKAMLKFIKESGDLKEGENQPEFKVGFTFSFPCALRKLNSAILMQWTKNFETGRGTDDKVEGQDVGDLLSAAFKRNEVPATCAAVANDTVGTLLSCAYEKEATLPQCLVGIILGTGMNACYYDEDCSYYNYQGNIINLECGNFNRELPRTNVDMDCDFQTSNRGEQLLEKMISGAYLGDLCRRIMVKVFQHEIPDMAWKQYSLASEDASVMAGDTTPNAILVQKFCKDKWQAEMNEDHCKKIQQICRAVFERSAALAACVIAALAQKTGHLQQAMGGLTVGVDGSLYKCNQFYRKAVRTNLKLLLGANAKLIHLSFADDGSGKGAGIIACTT